MRNIGIGIFSRTTALLGLLALAFACQPEKEPESQPAAPYSVDIPHFPTVDLGPEKALYPNRVALGKRLFFDPILSRNRDISCGTCHLPQLAFSDGLPVSVGTEGRRHFRNAPSLFNVLWQPYLFMDGGNPSLESQVIGPIEEPTEMDLPFTEALRRVGEHPDYPALFEAAFGEGVNPYTLTLALASYQRTLVSYRSAYDRFVFEGDSTALSASGQRGLALFSSARLSCESCHRLPLSTNFAFENNGLKADYSADPGRARVTNNLNEDEGKFKVPTLRNIALTAPYMHDGSLATLDAVLDHYAAGGSGHRLQSPLVQGFRLSAEERQDLLAFLAALTDTSSYRAFSP